MERVFSARGYSNTQDIVGSPMFEHYSDTTWKRKVPKYGVGIKKDNSYLQTTKRLKTHLKMTHDKRDVSASPKISIARTHT